MAFKARKTEHSGAKKGHGAFWGRKADAKRESNRKRREDAKALAREDLTDSRARRKNPSPGPLPSKGRREQD